MVLVSLFTFEENLKEKDILRLKWKRKGKIWVTPRKSRYEDQEFFLQFFSKQTLDDFLKNVDDESIREFMSLFKNNGESVIKRILCFVNTRKKILEVYRRCEEGDEIIDFVSEELRITPKKMRISPSSLIEICRLSRRVRSASFLRKDKIMISLEGNNLKENSLFLDFVSKMGKNMVSITAEPTIKFIGKRYCVGFDSRNSTISFPTDNLFIYTPRFEVRQVVSLIHKLNYSPHTPDTPPHV